MQDIIIIENLYKSYGSVQAVNNLSFKVKKGQLFAFLGINGAGKSTTISVMCKALDKDSGKVIINGLDIDTADDNFKRSLGVVFQQSTLDKSLTVYDNLQSRASLYGIYGKDFEDKINSLAQTLEFTDILNRAVGKLSGGQRRKIDVARALIHDPEILILDEPTTGLDPMTRTTLWKVVNDLRKQKGMTVFLTTHYMEEAADADYVVIIDGGKISAQGTPHQLKKDYSGDFITIYDVDEDAIKILDTPYEKVGSAYRLEVKDTKTATQLIIKNPEIFNDYEIAKGKMDDVFLAVTGKKLEGGESK